MKTMKKMKKEGGKSDVNVRKVMEKSGKGKGGPELSYCGQCRWNQELFNSVFGAKETGDSKKAIKKIKEALEQGADLNATDDYKQTILLVAARYGLTEMVKFLIKEGMNVNHMDNMGHTPLLQAIHERHYKTAELLLKNGAKEISKHKLSNYKNEMPASLMKRCQAEN